MPSDTVADILGSSDQLEQPKKRGPKPKAKDSSSTVTNMDLMKMAIAVSLFNDVITRYGLAGACGRKHELAKSLVRDGTTLLNMVDEIFNEE